jgi:hypothetical protein
MSCNLKFVLLVIALSAIITADIDLFNTSELVALANSGWGGG